MPDWTDEGKTQRQIERRRHYVKKMENQEDGWVFVAHVEFEGWGKCQLSGARLKKGIKVMNPVTKSTFIVAPDVALTYVDSVIIPRKRPENTQIEEKRPLIPIKDVRDHEKRDENG